MCSLHQKTFAECSVFIVLPLPSCAHYCHLVISNGVKPLVGIRVSYERNFHNIKSEENRDPKGATTILKCQFIQFELLLRFVKLKFFLPRFPLCCFADRITDDCLSKTRVKKWFQQWFIDWIHLFTDKWWTNSHTG